MLYFCQMRYVNYILIAIIAMCNNVNAQEKWDLRKIVDYAMSNNISVKQAGVQASISGLVYKQNRLSRYPSASFTGNTGFNSGRNQDPTSYRLIIQSYVNAGMQLQSSADIFNWFSKKNTMLATEWDFEAAKANTDKLKNDV